MARRSKKRTYSKNFYIAKAIALAIFPIILLVLPKDAFDKGPDICLFTLISGYHCWGCGMTRGCMHLIHLDFQTAWDYNARVYIVLPILCSLLLVDFIKTIKKIRNYGNEPVVAETAEVTEPNG